MTAMRTTAAMITAIAAGTMTREEMETTMDMRAAPDMDRTR
jgi:hypothetical protein